MCQRFVSDLPLPLHSQKQLAQWAVDVTARFYACWCTLSSVTPSGQYKYRTSPFLRCNFSGADVQSSDSIGISHDENDEMITNHGTELIVPRVYALQVNPKVMWQAEQLLSLRPTRN